MGFPAELLTGAAILTALVLVIVGVGVTAWRRSPRPPDTDDSADDPAADTQSEALRGRGELNRLLRKAADENRTLTLVILQVIRIRPKAGSSARAGHPRRVVQLGLQLQAAVPELLVTQLEDDQLGVAAADMDTHTLLTRLVWAVPWQHQSRKLQIDLRMGSAEYPKECPAIYQLVPRASACFQPWPRIPVTRRH